jgi:hypothetical protein
MWLCAIEQPCDVRGARRVAAEKAMFAKQPEVARARDRLGRGLRCNVLILRLAGLAIETVQQSVEFVLAEAEQIEGDPVLPQTIEFGGEQRVIPGAIDRQLVVGDAERARLRIGEMVEPDDGNLA